MAIDEQRLLREHYEILSDIKAIKEDIKDGKTTNEKLIEKLEELEKRAMQNDAEHLQFVQHKDLTEMKDILRRLKDGTIVMTPSQAKDSGQNWFSILMKNPQHLMWVILGVVIISMIIMGYSYSEISQVLERIK